jgi:catechol 2,3-dioxygenase-like lactoylglutathione lyase family enzyme
METPANLPQDRLHFERNRFLLVLSALALIVLLGALSACVLAKLQRTERHRDALRPLGTQLVFTATMLTVSDVPRSKAFYHDKLGFEVKEEHALIVLLQRADMRLYLIPYSPPTPDKPEITLMPPVRGEPVSVNLVFQVKDTGQAYDELRRAGVEFLTPPQRPPWGGWRCFTRDPDGYLIEIEEEPGDGGELMPSVL